MKPNKTLRSKLLSILFHALYIIPVAMIDIFVAGIQANAQTDSIGWQGKELIPLSRFTNASRWTPGNAAGATVNVTTDDSCMYIHWNFIAGDSFRYAQSYYTFDTVISVSGIDIIGFDVMDSAHHENRHIKMKLENTSERQAVYNWENLARINRWGNNISVLKKQLDAPESMNWDTITVLSFEIYRDHDINDTLADSGTVAIKYVRVDTIGNWSQADAFESIKDTGHLNTIKEEALSTIVSRQDTSTGLFHTWFEDNSSYLYGHGLVLKILSYEGTWEDSKPVDSIARAAEKLALFFVNNQEKQGFWPRSWHTHTGDIINFLEQDSTVWMGDFPWVITGLQNYYLQSGDVRVKTTIDKASLFLYNLIDNDGKLYTLNPYTYKKKEVTSTEAYAAAILCLYELGDSSAAGKMLEYIDNQTWDNDMEYWKEAISSSRVVLFANTWLAQLMKGTADSIKALNALSMVGNVLATKGPGVDIGLDGVGPIAVWYEGTLSYICAKGPGSQLLFDNVLKHRYPDGSVPHYNDSLPSMAGIWAVEWSSLDGTAWLYFAASKNSPFDILTPSLTGDITDEPKKVFIHYMGWYNDSIVEDSNESLRHWNCGYAHPPLIGEYDSKEWPLLAYHTLLAKSCGIDGMIINIHDPYDKKTLLNLNSTIKRLQAIDSTNFQFEFAISFDDQGMDIDSSPDTAIAKFTFLRDTLIPGSNAYLHYYDRPVIFIFNYVEKFLSAQDYRYNADSIFNDTPPLIVWNECRTEEVDFLNVCYPWVQPAPYDNWDTTYGLNWGKDYLDYFYNIKTNDDSIITKLDFICGGVWPGMDDRNNHCWDTLVDRWMDRKNGAIYDSTWLYIHNYEGLLPIKWVMIETWNDFNEGTDIECTMDHKHQYLDSTIQNINMFKNTSIGLDSNRYGATRQLYIAGNLLEKELRDSVRFYPMYKNAVINLLANNFLSSMASTDSIIHLDPEVRIIEPQDSIIHKYTDTIKIKITVDDPDNDQIDTILVYIDGVLQSGISEEIADSVYSFQWQDPDVKLYEIAVLATDIYGGIDSDTIHVRINSLPVVTIVAPADSTELTEGSDTTILIHAVDRNGIIDTVVIYINHYRYDTDNSGDDSIYSYILSDVKKDSFYIIYAKACDNDKTCSFSDTITIKGINGDNYIDNNIIINKIEVFPVPSNNQVIIRYTDYEVFGDIILQLINTKGVITRQIHINKDTEILTYIFHVEGLASGVYNILITNKGNTYIGKAYIIIE